MTPEMAETVALQALGWLAGSEELLPVFMGSTGASAEDLRARATDRAFLASVLSFVLMDDAWVTALSDATGLPPEAPMVAAQVLEGPASAHWT